jgi:hypothetical protein
MNAADEFGFGWGPMRVTRLMTGPKGERVLMVESESHKLEVCVSAKGQSFRVWIDGVPMVKLGDGA